jgi:hypothetical protein
MPPLIYILVSPLFIAAEEALGIWSLEGIIIRLLREPAPRWGIRRYIVGRAYSSYIRWDIFLGSVYLEKLRLR